MIYCVLWFIVFINSMLFAIEDLLIPSNEYFKPQRPALMVSPRVIVLNGVLGIAGKLVKE